MLRVVLDTSVYVSGFLVPHGLPAQVLDAWRAGRFTVLSSPDILDEVRSTLRKRRIRRRYPIDDGDVDEYVAFIQKRSRLVDGTRPVFDPRLRDPDDLIILACAADGDADLIVTGDKDLLVLGLFHRTAVVTAREFLEAYLSEPPI